MYLTDLRKDPPKPPYWPGTKTKERQDWFDRGFEIVDATLNSWKEAHDVFNSRLAKCRLPGQEVPKDHVDHITMGRMIPLVVKAIKQIEDDPQLVAFCTNTYPRECLAYALIVAWAEAEDPA